MTEEDSMTGWSRREVLRTGALVGIAGVAGCSGAEETNASNRTETTETGAATPTAEANAKRTARVEPTTATTATGGLPETVSVARTFVVETMATGLRVPWDLAFDSSGECYFTERPGRISVLTAPGRVRTLATARDTNGGREGGLLGITLHPTFPDPPAIYVYQTYRRADGERYNRIVRYHRTATGLRRRGVVLDGIPGDVRHNGGRLAFGPDGKLYATTGDTTEGSLAQDRSSLAGKTLRIDSEGTIPASNPFPGSPVWTYGHRNPQGLAWDPRTGRCYATEHGPAGHDEVNEIEPGRNYGWPAVAGRAEAPSVAPILASGDNSWAPSGAAVYSEGSFSGWNGSLLFTTLGYSTGDGRRSLHRVALDSGEDADSSNASDGGGDSTGGARSGVDHEVLLAGQFGRLRAVAVAPDGSIYVTNSNRDGRGDPAPMDDRIFRLRPTG